MAERDIFVHCLNSALAMENGLVDHLSKRADQAPLPALRERVRRHIEETRRHAEVVRAVLADLGETPGEGQATVQPAIDPSLVMKATGMLKVGPELQLLMAGPTDIAIEHYEDAMYAGIISQADMLGYSQHVEQLEAIRRDEQEMARFLTQGAPEVIRHVYERERAGAG